MGKTTTAKAWSGLEQAAQHQLQAFEHAGTLWGLRRTPRTFIPYADSVGVSGSSISFIIIFRPHSVFGAGKLPQSRKAREVYLERLGKACMGPDGPSDPSFQ